VAIAERRFCHHDAVICRNPFGKDMSDA